jgi:hypothetical protein
MSLESDGGMILTRENRRTRRKTGPSDTLSTRNPTWIDPGANPGLRGGRPATNDPSHGTASCMVTLCSEFRNERPEGRYIRFVLLFYDAISNTGII